MQTDESSIKSRLLRQSPFPDVEKAIAELSLLVRERPNDQAAWAQLAVAFRCANQLDVAIAAYYRALQLQPDDVGVLSNLGGALRAAGRLDEACELLQRAVKLGPDFAAAHFNLGLALEDAGRLDEALVAYSEAIRLEPDRTDARMQMAFSLLKKGDLKNGFAAYERRLEFEKRLQRNFLQPRWDGTPFPGKTLLLYSEQGLGDTFQFIRYAPMVKELGGRVIVECPATTADLVAGVDGVDEVVIQGGGLPAFHLHASLMSLPFLFGTTLDTIPNSIPYIRNIKPGSAKLWPSGLRKVGIVWTAGHEDLGAHARNVPFTEFARLLQLPNIALYSLQVGGAARDIAACGLGGIVQDLSPQLRTFADTADAIDQLDCVVSVDTAVIHLAGALGKPVFVLLPYANEWRWLQNCTDSSWYPPMRLYRQPKPFQWNDVMANVLKDLAN